MQLQHINRPTLLFSCKHLKTTQLKRGYIEFKYYADAIHSDLTPPG